VTSCALPAETAIADHPNTPGPECPAGPGTSLAPVDVATYAQIVARQADSSRSAEFRGPNGEDECVNRRPWSLATQAIVLQILVIAVVVLAGSALALFDAARDGDDAARQQVLGIATALADSPSTAAAIQSGRATETLQPVTEAVRKNTDIAFITIMAPDRTRFTHTDPTQIGGKYIGTIDPALRGETFTEVYTGTLGPSIRAVAPVRDGTGRIVGLVSAGILQQSLADRWRSQVPTIVAVSIAALAIALVGVWAIRRRLLRQTHGLRPDELRVMYEHHDAILHSVSEGLIVLDRNGVALANDEARRLLALPPGPVDRTDLPQFLRSYNPGARDEVHVTDDRVLVVNRAPVEDGPRDSEVVTIRDRTELQGALGELSSLKVLTDTLRSQAHEAANKLHTIVTMVEMGRADEAVTFATHELELSQQLVDRLSSAVGEPALVALLLGKSAQADERGIELTVTEETHLPANTDDLPMSGQEMVTVLGNLIDNAMDACDREDPWVEVTVTQDNGTLLIRVADSGPGMDPATFEKAMQRGYSTKSGSDTEQHGLGLALVAQVVKRHNGTLTADVSYGSVVTITVKS
jgi:sensor histidine kinase regulating citrate/malate metabolism